MKLVDTRTSYGAVTRILHWAVALSIIALVGIGAWMVTLNYYHAWYNDALELHKSLGMVALALAVAKVGWVMMSERVRFQGSLSALERAAAATTHRLFLVAMVLIPVTGYLVSTSQGQGIDVFGLFIVPAWGVIDDRLRDLAIDLHYYLAYGTAALACLHAAAAVKHQLIDGHGTLRRMLW